MTTAIQPVKEFEALERLPGFMHAHVFRGKGDSALELKPIPEPGFGEAVVRVTLTTICGTDIHIVRGEYPVKAGLTLGHEAVGVIHELGPGMLGYHPGQRVLVGAITPCGQCEACLAGDRSQCGGALGGWKFGNTLDGVQAEYVLVPNAQANLALVPDALTDEEVVLLADVASTGFSAAENGGVRIGDFVSVFALGPIGLCAVIGAKLRGASEIFVVDPNPFRQAIALRLGATRVFPSGPAGVNGIRQATGGRGVDVAIEALGEQETFENALRVLRPGGTLSSLGVYSRNLTIPEDAFAAGLADYKIVTTLCPGGKERMMRLMRMVAARRIDLKALLTHRFELADTRAAYDLFAAQ